MELEDAFGDDVEVSGEGTPDVTGFFEVSVNGNLIHSKTGRGEGYVDTPAKKKKIFDAVQSAMGQKG